jgi:hypothetical protein
MMQVSGVLSFKGTDEGMCFHPNEFNSGMDKRVGDVPNELIADSDSSPICNLIDE